MIGDGSPLGVFFDGPVRTEFSMLQASLTSCPIGHVLADRRAAASLDQLPAWEVVLDIVGDLFTYRRQLKHLDFDEGIVSLLGKLPVMSRR